MFTISVCMIVKNEQNTLARILECAKQFADEIIVVDTGSSDNTKQIAKIYTEKFFDYKWNNDFASARNFSFSKGTCDYLCWLDADDYIKKSEIQKIINLKNSQKDADVFMFRYAMGFDNGKPTFKFFRERLLKREKNFVWQGFVHEAISPSGKIVYEDIEIWHKKQSTSYSDRNLKIYQNAIKNGINLDARQTYYYARELFYHKQYSNCIDVLENYFLKNDNFMPNIIGAYLIKADCFVFQKKYNNAIDCLFDCIAKFLPTAEICCKLGEIYFYKNNLEQSVFWYTNALHCKKQTFGFVDEKYEFLFPCLQLTKIYYNLGDLEKSYKYHLFAKNVFPKNKCVLYNDNFFKNIKNKEKID